LFVEHYQRDEVRLERRERRTIFFQNEMPYDVPDQASWMSSPDRRRLPRSWSHRASSTFSGFGMGRANSYFNQGVDIHATRAFDVPDAPGVQLPQPPHVFLNGSGGHRPRWSTTPEPRSTPRTR